MRTKSMIAPDIRSPRMKLRMLLVPPCPMEKDGEEAIQASGEDGSAEAEILAPCPQQPEEDGEGATQLWVRGSQELEAFRRKLAERQGDDHLEIHTDDWVGVPDPPDAWEDSPEPPVRVIKSIPPLPPQDDQSEEVADETQCWGPGSPGYREFQDALKRPAAPSPVRPPQIRPPPQKAAVHIGLLKAVGGGMALGFGTLLGLLMLGLI